MTSVYLSMQQLLFFISPEYRLSVESRDLYERNSHEDLDWQDCSIHHHLEEENTSERGEDNEVIMYII